MRISLLDRSRTRAGEPPAAALAATVERARRAELLGLHRFWVAEHHAVPGGASSSPPVLMTAVAAATSRIRVGSGGIMLPHHRPIVVAGQARMLAALHPGRIDLGLGRSLGFTAPVREALGVTSYGPEELACDLEDLWNLLHDTGPVTVQPTGVEPPEVFVLATRTGLDVAAELGLPVVVGGPVVRGDHGPLQEYRDRFHARHELAEPRVVLSLDVMVADTREQARDLLLPEAWAMAESRATGVFGPLRPDPPARLTARQQDLVERQVAVSVHGTLEQVREELEELVERTGAVEVLATTSTCDRTALAEADAALGELAAATGGRVVVGQPGLEPGTDGL
jgi:luciferase family oxidoreductase group 1